MDKHPIRFGVQTGQQNIEWEQLRTFWGKADSWGYDSLWAFDHFYPIFVPDPTGLVGHRARSRNNDATLVETGLTNTSWIGSVLPPLGAPC